VIILRILIVQQKHIGLDFYMLTVRSFMMKLAEVTNAAFNYNQEISLHYMT